MIYYNSLIGEKLKTISEIQRINKQIDSHKRDKSDFSEQLEKIEQLKVQLDMLNSQILSYQMNANSDQAPEDLTEHFPGVSPESTIDNI